MSALSFISGFLTASVLVMFMALCFYIASNNNNRTENLLIPNKSKSSIQKIYYSRDNAGINNVRLQFESLIVLCYLTNRTLMIPQPSLIDHYDKKFSEFDVLDYDILSKYIKIQIYNGERPKNIYKLDLMLSNADYKRLPKNQDWWFDSRHSRIQHFQCLKLNSEDKEKAKYVISNAIAIKPELFNILDLTTNYLNIKDQQYNAIHLRRGDFLQYRKHLMFDEQTIAKKIKKELKNDMPLYIATNSDKQFIDNLKNILKDYKILTSFDYENKINDKIQNAMADMLICANSKKFFGTPLSTFSTGIIQFRRVLSLNFNKNIEIEAKSIIPGAKFQEDYSVTGNHGQCWDRLTRFK